MQCYHTKKPPSGYDYKSEYKLTSTDNKRNKKTPKKQQNKEISHGFNSPPYNKHIATNVSKKNHKLARHMLPTYIQTT